MSISSYGCTWEVRRGFKKLETLLSCCPNFRVCKRAESSKSCNLIGSESGRYFTILPLTRTESLAASSQTNILSLCPYSLMINQISKDIYIHLNSRELKARHVNSRSTTQCNATSRFRYTVSFGINVQDTIKYLPFGMSGTETESVTDATLLFTKTRKKLCKHITEKCSILCYG